MFDSAPEEKLLWTRINPRELSYTKMIHLENLADVFRVYMTRFFFFIINLLGRAFKVMKNGVYFIIIAFLVAELFKILIYAN